MDNQDIRTLKILEEIDNDDHVPSQRDLARKLNVSLGLVNSFIKRLAQKGYFKITTIPANRIKYILTPKGAAEKVRLTYDYIQYSIQYYKDTRGKLREFFEVLNGQGVKRVVFFGVSDLSEIAYISLQETNIKLAAVFDDELAGKLFMKFEIQSIDELQANVFDKIVITSFLDTDEIRKRLTKIGIPLHDIIVIEP